MYRLRFYPVPLALICFLWLTSFSGCGVVQECITGKDCPVKYTCQNGTCLAQTDPCAATGGTSCGSACVDLRTNNDHCGTCGTKCGVGSTCQNGLCKAVVPSCTSNADCPTGQTCQNGLCKAVTKPCQSNAECATGQICQNGLCVVAPKPVCTFGQDQTCNHRLEMSALAGTCLKDGTCQCNANFVKNQSSGKCDIACKASTEICNGLDDDCDGVIDNNCTCPSGQTRCGSICADLQTNNDHCGACGQKCGIGTGCKAGSCKPVVPPPCASNADCAAGQVCSNGQCQPHVAPCTSNANCAAGQVCLNGQCLGNKVDILFVIDNSGSMKEEQDRLLANISAFFAKLQQSKIDFQVAVLTTDVDKVFNAGGWGRFVQADSSTPKIISSSLPSAQIEAAFRKNANVGTKGSNFERPLEAIQIALSPSSAGGFVDTVNKGFLRSGAALAIFILSDEDDCSHEGMLDEHRASDTCYVPASVTLTDDQGNPLIGPNGMPEKGQMDKLASVSKYTQFLKRLNRKIILSGLIGNPFIYKPGTQTPIDPPTGCTQDNQCGSQGAQCRYQTNSPVTKKCGGCQSTDTSAIGGFRLFEAVSQIHPNNPEQYVFPICGDATAYSFALSEFANKIAQVNSPSPTCTQNSDCSSGLVCINGQCRPHVTPCASNMDCAAGQSCQNGQCK